jgi:ABC-type transport system substrate-binding protein
MWNSQLPTGSPNWVDPRKSEIGEGGQYFKFDPKEALKLIAAAGQKTVSIPFYYHNQDPQVPQRMDVFSSMLQEGGGFNLSGKILDYNSDWRQTCQASAGEAYTGLCYNNSGGFNEDAYLVAKYTVGGKYAVSSRPIEGITDQVQKVRTEPDANKRSSLIKDIQKQLAVQMTDIPYPGLTYSFTLNWPWLKNFGAFVGGGASSREFTEYWYDATLKS